MTIREINFDGIVGPTHHFGGLGIGNIASKENEGQIANPMAAALQGLEKMALMDSLGCLQAVLPPQPRPCFSLLEACGFSGTEAEIIQSAATAEPRLLSAAYSASSMWTANAATVSRGTADDPRVHFTPANLVSSVHRSIEPSTTAAILREIFHDTDHFIVHDPLPPAYALRDEGAANHMRFSSVDGSQAWEAFVYGDTTAPEAEHARFPARQTFATCRAIARKHRMHPNRVFFLEQHPDAIAAGAFHNDVVATSFENLLLFHQHAFIGAEQTLDALASEYRDKTGTPFIQIKVSEKDLSLEDAVSTYLFNSQIVRVQNQPEKPLALVCPAQCKDHPQAASVIEAILGDKTNPISTVHYVDLNQSMSNGGGPACLRLRVQVSPEQQEAIKPTVLWSKELHQKLKDWITDTYPREMTFERLQDPATIERCRKSIRELAELLDLKCLHA